MRTPRPAARSALAVGNVVTKTLDVLGPSVGFLHRSCPANPLIARKRRETIPSRTHLHRSHKRSPHISRYCMYNTDSESRHVYTSVANLFRLQYAELCLRYTIFMGTVSSYTIKFIGVSFASLYSLYYASTATQWHFIDYTNLIFHEAGHVLFMIFGEFIAIAMGSGLQVLLPLCISVYFFLQRQPISGALCLMWVGINVINVSIYAGDALYMQLPLLGGDSVLHDWNYILNSLNLLTWTSEVANALFALGVFLIGVGIVLSFRFVLTDKVSYVSE